MWNRSAWQSVGLALAVCPLAVVLLSGCGDDDGAAGLPATPTAAAATRSPTPVPLLIGAAKRDISPSLQTAPPDGAVWLGGYGIGRERRSTGLLAPIHVRAFVISDHDQTVVFAENETQGAFAAYKKDPVGLLDVAAAVETASGGRIPRQHVVVSSDHTHAGPDTTGVWGGLPASYLAFIRDQTVGAILDAVAAQKPAQLLTGTADASALLHSQFDAPPNDQVDGELRVLVAADPDVATRRQAVLINFAAHATVMGPGNLQISADWPGVVAEQVEAALGIDTAVVMVADVGRTQPSRPEDPGQSDPEKLTAYASDVTAKVLEATTNVTPATRGPIARRNSFSANPTTTPSSRWRCCAGSLRATTRHHGWTPASSARSCLPSASEICSSQRCPAKHIPPFSSRCRHASRRHGTSSSVWPTINSATRTAGGCPPAPRRRRWADHPARSARSHAPL